VRILLPVLALLVLSACAAQPAGSDGGASGSERSTAGPTSDPAAGGIEPTQNDLIIELDRGDGSAVERYTLICAGAVEGTHPAAQAACDHLSGMDDPFAPLPADAMCTQVYDGPQTAHVTGRWGGRPVDVRLARNDGCHISQWDGLGPLLPA
jgi:hypothetical protein